MRAGGREGLRHRRNVVRIEVCDSSERQEKQLANSNWQLATGKIFYRNERKDRKGGFIFPLSITSFALFASSAVKGFG
jgi:hypothetical protein